MSPIVWIGVSLAAVSLVVRYHAMRTWIEVCGEHFEQLEALLPGFNMADFDEMICRHSRVLLVLPPEIRAAGFRRVALRNWARALFWIGLLLIVVGLFPIR